MKLITMLLTLIALAVTAIGSAIPAVMETTDVSTFISRSNDLLLMLIFHRSLQSVLMDQLVAPNLRSSLVGSPTIPTVTT